MTRRIKAETLRQVIRLIDAHISTIPPDSIRRRNQIEKYRRYKAEITRYYNDLPRVPARNTESRSPHTPTPEPPRRRT